MILNQALLYASGQPPSPPMPYVVVGTNNRIVTSTDGVTWTQQTTPVDYGTKTAGSFNSVKYNNGLYTITGGTVRGAQTGPADPGKPQILVSNDAVNWRTISMTNNPGLNVNDASSNDSMYLNGFTYIVGSMLGQGGNPPSWSYVNRSFDSRSYGYQQMLDNTGMPLTGAYINYNTYTRNGVGYIAVGNGVLQTTDGKYYQFLGNSSPFSNFLSDITYFSAVNPNFYAVSGSFIWRYNSSTGFWVNIKSPGGGRILSSPSVMLVYGGQLQRTVNGTNWFSVATPQTFGHIVWSGTQFWACGTDRIYTSPDGLTWTANAGYPSSIPPLRIFAQE